MAKIIVFTIDDQRYGIRLDSVERVDRMVEITPLPAAPLFVLGVVDFHGVIMPVINLRQRFGLPERPVKPGDQLIITHSGTRSFALVADTACDVCEYAEQMFTESADILTDLPFLAGVARFPDGLILLHDLDTLLSADEERILDEAILQEQV